MCSRTSGRSKVEHEFNRIFTEVTDVANKLGVEVRAPRAPSVSRFRSNAGYYEDTEIYYSLIVFISAVEAVTLDLQDRFTKQQKAAFSLAFLLPKHTWDLVQPSFQKYTNVLRWQVSEISEEQAKAEFAVWSAMCRLKLQGQLAQDAVSAISAVNLCPADSLPTYYTYNFDDSCNPASLHSRSGKIIFQGGTHPECIAQ